MRKANGASIAAIRKLTGSRQAALAARCAITGPYLSQIESGERQPATEVLARIAAELGVTVEAISYVEAVEVAPA